MECVRTADFDVNEAEYGKGNRPDDAECRRVLRGAGADAYTQAMELGRKKHQAAFECARSWLCSEFGEHLSVELSCSANGGGKWVVTTPGPGTLRPDVVVHMARNAGRVQCVYDFKFPCTLAHPAYTLANWNVF